LSIHVLGVGDAERHRTPHRCLGGVADVGALGEALAHGAGAVGDAHRPHAAAEPVEADLEGQVDVGGAVFAQQERQRLENRARRGGAEAARIDLQVVEAVAQIPARRCGDDRLQRAPALGERIERPPREIDGDEAALGQRTQARREDARRDAAARAQLLETEWPAEQMPHQYQRPAIADDVECAAHRTEDLARGQDQPSSYRSGHGMTY
jgi:hypothetical protein